MGLCVTWSLILWVVRRPRICDRRLVTVLDMADVVRLFRGSLSRWLVVVPRRVCLCTLLTATMVRLRSVSIVLRCTRLIRAAC